jgi:hypothetical protein
MMLGTETEDSHRTADAAGAPRRADYGAVRLGQRDIDGLILCAEHFGAPYDLLAAALGAQPARLRGITARWRRAGYAATGRLGPGPAWCWLTPAGMNAAGLGGRAPLAPGVHGAVQRVRPAHGDRRRDRVRGDGKAPPRPRSDGG